MGVMRGSDGLLSLLLVSMGGSRWVSCSAFGANGRGTTRNVGEGVVFGDCEKAASMLCCLVVFAVLVVVFSNRERDMLDTILSFFLVSLSREFRRIKSDRL